MKRSRVEESRYVSIWARLVTKLLFVMIRLSELALNLLGERRHSGTLEEEEYEVETDPEEGKWESVQPHGRNKAYTLWPTTSEKSSPSIETITPLTRVAQTPRSTSEEKYSLSYHPSPASPQTPTELREPRPTPKMRPIQTNKNRKSQDKHVEVEEDKISQEACKHTRTSKKGTNAFALIEKCLQCGKTLKSERKPEAPEITLKKDIKTEIDSPTESTEEKSQEFQEFLEYQKWKSQKGAQKKK